MKLLARIEFGNLEKHYKWPIKEMIIKKGKTKFAELYNEFVEESNKVIQGLNDEFDATHSDVDYWNDQEYMEFICNGFQKCADKVNGRNPDSEFELRIDKDTASAYGVLKDKKTYGTSDEITVRFVIEEI